MIKLENLGRSSRLSAAGLIAASVAFVIELTAVPMALPAIREAFDLTFSELAWVYNAYSVSVALAVVVSGWIATRGDGRRVFHVGLSLFALGSLLCALSTSYSSFLMFRVIQGVGGGLFTPLVPVFLTRIYSNRPGQILSIWGGIAAIFAAFVPIIGGGAISSLGWQTIFVFTTCISFFAFCLLNTKILHSSELGFFTTSYFRSATRRLWAAMAYVFFTNGCVFLYFFNLPLIMEASDNLTDYAGYLFSIMWISFSISSHIIRNRLDDNGLYTILCSSPLVIFAGLSLVFLNQSPIWLIVSAVLIGAGFAGCNAPSTALILRLSPRGTEAFSASLDITSARLGGVISVGGISYLGVESTVVAALAFTVLGVSFAILSVSGLGGQGPMQQPFVPED